MSSIDTNGSAFPSHGSMGERVESGMTLRDYFAAKAMQGMISSGTGYSIYKEKEVITGPRAMAPKAYEYADAMLAEREKP